MYIEPFAPRSTTLPRPAVQPESTPLRRFQNVKPRRRTLLIATATAVAALTTFIVLSANGVFDYDVWYRETPLRDPITVTSVRDGTMTLADGRSFRPAGVRRGDGVQVGDYDNALRVMCAQGVVVIRDLGDGTAFLVAEPKFYNWCGTRNHLGIPSARWGGSYFQVPLSELLVQTAHAKPDLDQTRLTAHERWRLEGLEHLEAMVSESPTRISARLDAFRYDGRERYLSELNSTIELMWKPPPP